MTATTNTVGTNVPDRPWLAAVAVVPILATVYQTLVLTDVTNDVIRKGIEAEHLRSPEIERIVGPAV